MVIHALCFTDMDNEEVSRISSDLYTILDNIIGDPVEIEIRRTSTNLRDILLRKEHELGNTEFIPCYSGSKAEGLRFKSSDEDWMFIYRDFKVIPSDSYMTIYDSNTTLLLMENEMTKPGFTLLRLIGECTKPQVTESTESLLNGCYLSCKYWRECHTASYPIPIFTHGPCASGTHSSKEFDYAYCLQSDIWPTNAHDCIKRLHHCGWPSHDTLLSIVNDGVLFVPIGAKQSIFENTEWRMSFSLAEKKLIHALNHTQFLCYGLLKIFLKEAIDVNPNAKGLLCSYFMKTALFWEITTAVNHWEGPSLLPCFWNCFCRLLKWVNCSYCPNFFIPQNNMFAGKIQGVNRDKLIYHLRTLYNEGYQCFLRCQSLSLHMSCIIDNPIIELVSPPLSISTIAIIIISECYNQLARVHIENKTNSKDISAIRCLLVYQFAANTNNSHKRFIWRMLLSKTLIPICMTERNSNSAQGRCNRSYYRSFTERLNVLQRFAMDSVSHILYQAMLCYKAGKYNQTLTLVQLSKRKITARRAIYITEKVTKEQYKEAGGEVLPIETMLRKHVINDISIESDLFISELYIESHICFVFFIPIIICTLFLQYLCQNRLGSRREADETLYEIFQLVNNGQYTGKDTQGISWQILGVCQQMSGDDEAACRSYLTVLMQGDNLLKVPASIRLGTILVKYFTWSEADEWLYTSCMSV